MTETEQFPWEAEAAAPTAKKGKSKPAAAPADPSAVLSLDMVPVPEMEGADTDNMPRADVLAIWKEQAGLLAPLLEEAKTLKVTDINDTAGMARAKELRGKIREIRLFTDRKHKELKEYFLRGGQKIDKFKKAIMDVAEPAEALLKASEDFAEIETARLEGERRVNRMLELQPFLMEGQRPTADVGIMTDGEWADFFSDAKDFHALRVAREEKARQEREAAEQAERDRIERERQEQEAERVRLKAENDRLIADQKAEREAAAREREAAAAEQAKRDAAARAEREALEAARRKEQAAADEERRAAKEEADRKQRELDKARAEAERLQAEADRKEAEQKILAVRAEQERAEAARRAAVAPDKEKLAAFAKQVQELAVPRLSPAASGTESLIAEKMQAAARWILAEAAKL